MRTLDIVLFGILMAVAGFFASQFLYDYGVIWGPNNSKLEDSKIENEMSQIEEKLAQIDDKIEKKTISLENTINKQIEEKLAQIGDKIEKKIISLEDTIKAQKVEEKIAVQNNEQQLFEQECGKSPAVKNWVEFKEKILKNNEIYNTIKTDPEKFDPQGWGFTHLYYVNLIEEVAKDTNDNEIRIIEVGSWKGGSARDAGAACRNLTARTKKPCYILSIDTWLASSEHYEGFLPEMKSNLYINDLFNTFLNNIKVKGFDDIVYPLRLPSTAAVHILHCFKIDAHIIFIDADHDYKPVLRDIETFYPLLKKNGIIFGDDMPWTGMDGFNENCSPFPAIKGKKLAVDGQVVQEADLPIWQVKQCWVRSR